MTSADPSFEKSEFNTPAVQHVASVLSAFCGRTPDGGHQMCGHDHRGEAAVLVEQIERESLRPIVESAEDDTHDLGAAIRSRYSKLATKMPTEVPPR